MFILEKWKYKVMSYNASHNQDLVNLAMKYMLKINRNMLKAKKLHGKDANKLGISIKATFELMGIELGGQEHLGFLEKDYRNYIHRKRKAAMEKRDAREILQYFQKVQSENPIYFYAIQQDKDDMLTNIFWVDAQSMSDYDLFEYIFLF